MRTEITLDALSETAVTVHTHIVVESAGVQYETQPQSKAYINSAEGREILKSELAEPFLSAVLGVWGDEPLLTEPLYNTDLPLVDSMEGENYGNN